MAAVAPPADQTADLLKNLSLDSQSKSLEVPEPAKKPSIDSANNGIRSLTPLIPDFMDPTVAYFPNGYPYFYGGYDGGSNDWDEYSRYVNIDGVDMSHGVYGENGSVMYPGYGYAPYSPYSPAGPPMSTTGQDGQLYGPHHYQMSVDPTIGNPGSMVKGNTAVRPTTYQDSVFNSNGSYGTSGAQNMFPDPRYGFNGPHSSVPWLDGPTTKTASLSNANGFASKNQNVWTHSHVMNPRPMSGINAANGYMNRMYPNKLYSNYQATYGSGFGYGSNTYGSNWLNVDNKSRGFNELNRDGLNELNRGPRARTIKNQKVPSQVNTGQHGAAIDDVEKEKDQYNKEDFPETYVDAKFFVIKSYSEDDVHKSIKYNVWSSTQNGNKKLDAAYQEAQQKPEKCPVFLLFSVNTSGQFVGVAEMVGPVDFNKSLEYWQQDKWIGCLPVKWHIVKDLPNSLLKHIILENNENKPVTNSRDTQEVKLEQGLQVIKIFKGHCSKQCILDDFEFYEERQKRIQEKKAKQQFQKQAWDEKEKPNITEKKNEEIVGENAELKVVAI